MEFKKTLDGWEKTGNKLNSCLVQKDIGDGKGTRTIPAVVVGTLVSNADPEYDICSDVKSAKAVAAATSTATGNATDPPEIGYKIEMNSTNIGDLLNKKHISWGWFSDGFKLPGGKCISRSIHGTWEFNYFPSVEPFQYYKSTANPKHLPPKTTSSIGESDQANHQYDVSDFWQAVNHGRMPAVSFIKAPTYQDGHPGLSDPLAEQTFLVNTINGIEKSKQWNNTAIILTWDDSGGFYDHLMPPIVSPSNDPKNDALYGHTTLCNPSAVAKIPQNDKCGYGPRIPLLIISPYAKENFVYYSKPTDFTSILRFIEDNWGLPKISGGSLDAKAGSLMNMFDFTGTHQTLSPLYLDPTTGEVKK